MTPPERVLPPELPPPPLADSDRLAEEALPRFPDTPLPWAVVPAGLVAGVTGPGLEWLRQPWLATAAGASGRWAPPALGLAQLPRLVLEQALLGALFPLALVVADRVLRPWPRAWRWAVAGVADGLLFSLVILGPNLIGMLTGVGAAVVARFVVQNALPILPTVLRGLIHGVFARWRRHPSLVFAMAGAVSVLAALPTSLLAALAGGRPGPQTWAALMAWPWWFLPLTLVTSLASSAVYGAIFGYAILWSDDQRVARERAHR